MLPPRPRRPITDDEIETFWRDGVVCLRQIMPVEWLDHMAGEVDDALASASTTDLSAFGDELARTAGAVRLVDDAVARLGVPRGHFLAGTDHWREQPAFVDFALASPLPEIVAALLRRERVWFYEDSVLVKEPGTQEKTAFHQDLAYFHLAGELIATTWVPLDPVDATTGAVRFVVGSHRDRTAYRPNTFVTDLSLGGPDAIDVPDYAAAEAVTGRPTRPSTARIVSFDTEPGDITVHHARTIHGAYANASATRRRRAISVRYAGDGTTFRPVAGLEKPHHAAMHAGDALDPTACPLAWPSPPRAAEPSAEVVEEGVLERPVETE